MKLQSELWFYVIALVLLALTVGGFAVLEWLMVR